MPNSARLIEAAMSLRSETPHAWHNFVEAMREYSVMVNAEMVKCSPELLLRAQGMSIMCNELSSILVNAPALYEKIQLSRMEKRNG